MLSRAALMSIRAAGPTNRTQGETARKVSSFRGVFLYSPLPLTLFGDFSYSRSRQQKDSHSLSQILFSSSSPLLPLPQCLVEREAPFTASLPFIPPRQLTPAFIPRIDGDWMEAAGRRAERLWGDEPEDAGFIYPPFPAAAFLLSHQPRQASEGETMNALFTPSLYRSACLSSSCLLSSSSSSSSSLPSSLLSPCPSLRRVSFRRRRLAKAARSSRRLCLS